MKNGTLAVPRNDVAWRRVGDEVLILHLRSGYYYSLNATGARLFEELAAGQDAAAAVRAVVREFAVDAERAQRDCDTLVADLRAEAILVPA